AAWIPIIPKSDIPADGPPPRVMAYVKKSRTDFEITLRTDIAQDLDIQVIDVTQAGAPTITFVNIYNDPKQIRRPAIERLKALDLPHNRPVVLLGDWNLHHELWSRGQI
ncbi:hypothetical protein C8J57DRAFT_990898, partial [Mycena rebaudengoi]